MAHTVGNAQERVVYFSDSMKQVYCKSIMFGMMVELAQGTVESFQSDFYYDALFINKLTLDTPQEFYYLFGESGTTIIHKGESSYSPQALAMECRKYSREWVYKVELLAPEKERSTAWSIRFTCLAIKETPLLPYNERASFNYSALYSQNKVD